MDIQSFKYTEHERTLIDIYYLGAIIDSVVLKPEEDSYLLDDTGKSTPRLDITIAKPYERIYHWLTPGYSVRVKTGTVKIANPQFGTVAPPMPEAGTAEGTPNAAEE